LETIIELKLRTPGEKFLATPLFGFDRNENSAIRSADPEK